MKTGIFRDLPLESALKGAGFKVNGIERKSGKTVITVERVSLKGSTGADTACRKNSPVRENRNLARKH